MTTTTLTKCEEAALELADVKAAWKAAIKGKSVNGFGHADKNLRYNPVDLTALANEKRRLQAIVDKCNGCRSTGRFVRFEPDDGDRRRGCC